MRTCPSCGFENADDADFCARCSEYLAWQPTGPVAPADPPPPQTGSEEPTLVEAPATTGAEDLPSVLVTLRLPDEEAAADAVPAVQVAPGAEARLVGFVRNQSPIVDNYDLRVEGIPAGWCSVAPQAIYLLPFDAREGTFEQETQVSIRPPRAPEAEARAWPLSLVAASRSRPDTAGRAAGVLVVEPYWELEAELRPERASGERGARFMLTVRNRGNATVAVALSGDDSEGALRFVFQPARLQIGPGGAVSTQVDVDAGGGRTGPDRELGIRVRARGEGAAAEAAAETRAAFVHLGREPRRLRTKGQLLALRLALTILAATLLIGGSFSTWAQRDGTRQTGVCTNGGEGECLDYADTVNVVAGSDVLSDAPDDLPRALYFVGSAGFATIVLGVLALLGLRRGRSTWFAGCLAVVGLVVLAIQADAEPGIWIPFLGGLAAVVAGFLPVLQRE